jgi:hypothetical protein
VKAPKRLLTGGRAVRLDGYRLQPANTLEVLGIGREKILLLVVPPQTDPDHAHQTMMTAAAPDNASSVDDLLGISAHDRDAHDRTSATDNAGRRARRAGRDDQIGPGIQGVQRLRCRRRGSPGIDLAAKVSALRYAKVVGSQRFLS